MCMVDTGMDINTIFIPKIQKYSTVGPKVTLYKGCVYCKICQGKVVIKGRDIQVKEHLVK